MSASEFRIEHNSMGRRVPVPAHVYYGAQTQRAVENFAISGAITLAAQSGNFEMNVTMPILALKLLESVNL